MDIINTMGPQHEAEPSLRVELSEVSEEAPTQNTDQQLVCDTTGELLIALGSLSKFSSLIAAVKEALAESTDAASLLQAATRRMLAVRSAVCALEARRAEERALAAAKLELEERLRAEAKAEAAREAEERLLASELGAKILAERDQKEKAIRRESGGLVPWLLGLA